MPVYKIIAACGAGMGTSMIIRIKLKKIAEKLQINAEIDSMSISQAKSMCTQVDLIVTSSHLVNEFDQTKKSKIVGVKNLINEQELEAALKTVLTNTRGS